MGERVGKIKFKLSRGQSVLLVGKDNNLLFILVENSNLLPIALYVEVAAAMVEL
jgi:hypothetical protein